MLQDNKACLNSTGYEFIRIDSPKNTAIEIKNFLKDKKIFGTIYVSVEGININLAGEEKIIKSLEEIFHQHELFKNILLTSFLMLIISDLTFTFSFLKGGLSE